MIKYEIRKHFSEYVTREIIERQIHPWYLAYYSETSETFLRSCLKMKTLPKLISLIQIAELLECSLNELLGFEFVAIEPADHLFESGLDMKPTVDYFVEQITKRGFDAETFEFDDPDDSVDIKRCIRLRNAPRLPKTDAFLQICEALNCTPSDLLGY